MTRRDDISDPNPLTGRFNLPIAERPDSLDHSRMMNECCAVARDAEICQKIEIEIVFRHRLIAALDQVGYMVKENGTTMDERARVSLREKYEKEPARTSNPRTFFFVHSKEECAAFYFAVWFSSDTTTPTKLKWRPLEGDGVSVAGPLKMKAWNGVSFCDTAPPLCYQVSIIDARLRLEALPLPVMRDTLLGGHLAEELAAIVAIAFERISAIRAD